MRLLALIFASPIFIHIQAQFHMAACLHLTGSRPRATHLHARRSQDRQPDELRSKACCGHAQNIVACHEVDQGTNILWLLDRAHQGLLHPTPARNTQRVFQPQQ